MRRWWTQKRWMLTLAFVVLFVPTVFLYFKDIPPPDISDLELTEREFVNDPNENGYLALALIDFSALPDPSSAWDADVVGEIVITHAATHTEILAALEKPHFAPAIFSQAVPVMTLATTNRLLLANLRYCVHERRFADAVVAAQRIDHYHTRMLDSADRCYGYFVACQSNYPFFKELRRMILHPDVAIEDLRTLQDVMPDANRLDRALEQGIKGEFSHFRTLTLDELQRSIPGGQFLLKRNATTKFAAGFYRPFLENVSKPAFSRDLSFLSRYTSSSLSDQILSGNPIGLRMFRPDFPHVAQMLDGHISRKVSCQLLHVAVALRIHELEHGAYPDTLTPLDGRLDITDPFNGKRLRYDLTKQVLYSVGADLADNGGDAASDTVFSFRPDE